MSHWGPLPAAEASSQAFLEWRLGHGTWEVIMNTVASKSFDAPDEQHTPPSTTIDVVNVGGHAVARITFQPGWRRTEHIAPVMGTDTARPGISGPS